MASGDNEAKDAAFDQIEHDDEEVHHVSSTKEVP